MRSNRNVGGNVVEGSGTWSVIRGLGLIESARDIEHVVIGADGGVPIFVRQVADVKIGDAFRVAVFHSLGTMTDNAAGPHSRTMRRFEIPKCQDRGLAVLRRA